MNSGGWEKWFYGNLGWRNERERVCVGLVQWQRLPRGRVSELQGTGEVGPRHTTPHPSILWAFSALLGVFDSVLLGSVLSLTFIITLLYYYSFKPIRFSVWIYKYFLNKFEKWEWWKTGVRGSDSLHQPDWHSLYAYRYGCNNVHLNPTSRM